MKIVQIKDFLIRNKEPVIIDDKKRYRRVTIKINHQGMNLRDEEIGSRIGTKRQFIIHDKQFLLSKIDALNGAFGIVPQDLDGAIITGNFWTFDVNESLVNTEWFLIFTSSKEFIDICRRSSSGTTNRKYLDEKKFLGQEIKLPDKNVQTDYISRYKVYEKLKNENTFQLSRIEQMRQTILVDILK